MAALSSTFLLPKLSNNGFHSSSSSSSSSAKLPTKPFKPSASHTTTTTKQPRTTTSSHHASLYEVLGVPSTATCRDIKAAYRKLARTCHPDVAAVKKEEASPAAEFVKIHEAYSTLADPNKRATYDYGLYGRFGRVCSSTPAAAGTRFSGFTRKKWETDQCW